MSSMEHATYSPDLEGFSNGVTQNKPQDVEVHFVAAANSGSVQAKLDIDHTHIDRILL